MSYKGSPFPQVQYKMNSRRNKLILDDEKSCYCWCKSKTFCKTISLSWQVAEKIQEELEDYRSKEESIKKMKHDMGLETGSENDAAIGMLSDNTQVSTFNNRFFNCSYLMFLSFGALASYFSCKLLACVVGKKATYWHAHHNSDLYPRPGKFVLYWSSKRILTCWYLNLYFPSNCRNVPINVLDKNSEAGCIFWTRRKNYVESNVR